MSYLHNWTSQSVQAVSYKNESCDIIEVDIFHSETLRSILMNISKFF